MSNDSYIFFCDPGIEDFRISYLSTVFIMRESNLYLLQISKKILLTF